MHILLVHQYFLGKNDAGGSRWNQFAKYWSQKGHRITVLAGTVHYASGQKEEKYRRRFIVREAESEGIEILRCYVSDQYNKSFLGRFWAYLSFAISSITAGLFKAASYDIIICTSPPLTVGLTGCVLSRIKNVPLVFEVRDLWPESAIDTGVLTNSLLIRLSYWLERLSYRNASWINALTPAFEKALIEYKGIRSERISMIPNAADLDLFRPNLSGTEVRDKYDLHGRFVVTYVGAHGVANHLIQLLEAAKLLEKNPDIVFMLVGDGMQKPLLQKTAADWNLRNVIFVDPVAKHEIADYLAASDICTAVLKKVDTFKTVYPNKMFDYMAMAKPVILGIDGVARELIENAGAGVYVTPEDAQAFAAAVMRFKTDADLRKDCGASGLKFVSEKFSRHVLADRYIKILQTHVLEQAGTCAVLQK